ncbi:major capsid protein [Streptacidiphilus sp. EB103A]|uniref:major capsid protein n=1 Tax=Streptacidiphilus sp. EB103A TaxID=3156275 RepID=UPI0035166D52
MPVTLAQAQINSQNDIDYAVIDNLRRYSWLFDQMVWDDVVTPGTGGGSLTYGYTRLTAAAPAAFRTYNQEFPTNQAARQRYTVDLKPFGGAFSLDRVLADLGSAATNELTFQMQQLLTTIPVRLGQEIILGDTAVDATGFDGLSKALVGSTTEKSAGYVSGSADWTAATVNTQALANSRLDEFDDLLSTVVPSHTGSGDQGAPGSLPPGRKAIIGNTKSITRVRALARWAALYTNAKDDLGRQIEMYGDWVLVDIGDRYDGSSPIIPITSGGLTDIYAVTFGLDAFHGAAVAGRSLVRTWLPNWTVAGAVKSGEVEIGPLAAVLKNTKSSAVLRGVKVQ